MTMTLVNIPGSVMAQVFASESLSDATSGNTISDVLESAIRSSKGLLENDVSMALLTGPPFRILEVTSTSSTVKQIGPEAAKLLQRADALLKRATVVERALRYGRIGSAAAIFIAGVLYSPDLGPAKAYQLHQDFAASLKEWRTTLGLVDIPTVANRLSNCDFDNPAYQKLLIYDYLEIYHDYALISAMGLEEIEVIPESLRDHVVVKKAQEAGDLLGGYGNRLALKRNFQANAGTSPSAYSAYNHLIKAKLDNALSKKPAITPREAFEELKQIICAVQEALHSSGSHLIPNEQGYFQIKRTGDELLTDPSWMEEYFLDPEEVELENYERRLEDLDEDEWNRYLWLLCAWRNDCRFNTTKYEQHHIIPKEWEYHPLVAAARACADKFYFNGNDNLIALEKYVDATKSGRHGNHPRYNDWIEILLDEALRKHEKDNNGLAPDPCQGRKILKNLVVKLLTVINSTNKTINQIGDEQLKLLKK
jgi:hypothetical protein